MTHQPEQRNPFYEAGPVKQSRPGLIRARLQRGLTQERAAEQIGVSLSTWARWERGTQNVRPFYRKVLAEQWDAELGEVDTWFQVTVCPSFAPCADMAVAEAGLAKPMLHVSSVETARHLWRLEMDTSRRHLLVALPFVPAALGEWLLSWQFDTASTAQHTTGTGVAVGPTDVQRVREAHHAFARMDHQFGAGLVRPAVTDFMNTTLAPLLQGSASEQVRAELLSAAAAMTRMAGWMAFDLGHQGQAQAHFGQALSLAKQAGDDLTAAWVLATMAQQACDLGHGRWAVRLANAAADAGTRASATPRVHALLSLRRAHALSSGATQPDHRPDSHTVSQVSAMLTQADQQFAQGPHERDPAWVAHFSEAELAGEGGLCWRGIGEFQRGIASQQHAMASFGNRYPRSVQLTQTSVAEGYLGMGDIEAALEHARAAVISAKDLTSTRATAHLHDFTTHLKAHRDSAHVRDFTDYLRAELAS